VPDAIWAGSLRRELATHSKTPQKPHAGQSFPRPTMSKPKTQRLEPRPLNCFLGRILDVVQQLNHPFLILKIKFSLGTGLTLFDLLQQSGVSGSRRRNGPSHTQPRRPWLDGNANGQIDKRATRYGRETGSHGNSKRKTNVLPRPVH
jgi:hypothetical protein